MAIIIKKPATIQPGQPSQAPALNENPATNTPVQPQPIQAASKPTITNDAASQLDLAIQANINTLYAKLEAAIPDLKSEMLFIHKALAKDPAQVTLLNQDEIATIFKGYSRLTNIELQASADKKKGKKVTESVDAFE